MKNKDFVEILLRANYDPIKRKINHAYYTKGENKWIDIIYFHELRHKIQHDNDIFTIMYFYFFYFVLFFVILSSFLDNLILLSWVPVGYLISYLCLEIDAWIYAIKKSDEN